MKICYIQDCDNKHHAKGMCRSHYFKKKYSENLDYHKKYYKDNRGRLLEQDKIYAENNKELIRDRQRKYDFDRRRCDINFRLRKNLRNRINSALTRGYKSGSAVSDLGCSIDELKEHLESKFQPGMSWDNYGEWHIDHIEPLSGFDLSERNQLLKACHYTNLQPLWAKENISKGGI